MAIRLLVVDDSLFMRNLIVRMVSDDPAIHVVGTAKNGAEAVQLTSSLRPNVITMDVEMPVMDGLQAVERIMEACPTPIIMLSSLTTAGARETIRALSLGALDFLAKPTGSVSPATAALRDELIQKIKTAAFASVTKLSGIASVPRTRMVVAERRSPQGVPGTVPRPFQHIVAIGTSTGGPRALDHVIPLLPQSLPAPVVVVQHMPPKFTASLADRLNAISPMEVAEAVDGEVLTAGKVYVAAGGKHLLVQRQGATYRVVLTEQAAVNGHRPSVDTLFDSVATLNGLRRHLVLMTGMGSDGAAGMLAAKTAGAITTIAESQETCVVFGMPKAAIGLGCVDFVLPVTRIAEKIIHVVAD